MSRPTPRSKPRSRAGRPVARIAARPVRGAGRRRLIWGGALAGVFAAGIGFGLLGGYGAGIGEKERAQAPLDAGPPAETASPREFSDPLPVDVRSSDKARTAYMEAYEEDLSRAPPPPDLGPAVPAPVPKLPARDAPAPEASEAPEPSGTEAVAPPETAEPARPETPEPGSEPRPAPTPGAGADAPAGWLANAQAVTLDPARPILAVVIDDVGVDVAHSREAVRLPGPLTFAFLPYGFDLPAMVGTARRNGHEVMVHLPMEPTNPKVDPGPNALLTELSPAEIDRRIAWNLARIDRPVGLNNHMGSKFSTRADGMRQVLGAVAEKGLIFLDSVTTADTQGYRLAEEMGVPYAVRDVFIDHALDEATIRAQLAAALETARRQGFAVAIGHPHDETLDVLRSWLPTVAGQGVQLVPISAIIKRRYGAG